MGAKIPPSKGLDFFGRVWYNIFDIFAIKCTAHSLCGLPSFSIGAGEGGFFVYNRFFISSGLLISVTFGLPGTLNVIFMSGFVIFTMPNFLLLVS